MLRRLICICLLCLAGITIAQEETPEPEPIPDPVPLVDAGDFDIVNILLIGVANDNLARPGLADAIIVLSVNRDLGVVSVVSLPRDLWVYVEGYGMSKLNQAHFYGEANSDPAINGVSLLKQTITYNFGITIDYYARIDFTGLKSIVDTLGGIWITVDCSLQDWKIIDPLGDRNDEDNWELYTLDAGMRMLDGETALWYARSRRTSSDLDRSRRQQDIFRAIWRTFHRRDLLNDLPTLFAQFTDTVDTDITPDALLSFAPIALNTRTGDVNYLWMRVHHEIENAFSAGEGRAIFAINTDAMQTLMQNLVLPPSVHQRATQHPTVAVVNATGTLAMDWAYVAAQRLELEGFKTILLEESTNHRQWNHIIDYTGDDKNNPIETIQKVLSVTDEGVSIEPNPDRVYTTRFTSDQIMDGICVPALSCHPSR